MSVDKNCNATMATTPANVIPASPLKRRAVSMATTVDTMVYKSFGPIPLNISYVYCNSNLFLLKVYLFFKIKLIFIHIQIGPEFCYVNFLLTLLVLLS